MSPNVQELRVIRSDSIAFCPWIFYARSQPHCRRVNEFQKTKRDYELDRQMSAEEKRWHTPSCTCDVDGPPGIGTCPECGAYNAY